MRKEYPWNSDDEADKANHKLAWLLGGDVFDAVDNRYWSQRYRYFHTSDHLDAMYRGAAGFAEPLSQTMMDQLLVAIVFHDAVYYPWRTDNEEASAQLFRDLQPKFRTKIEGGEDIVTAILETKDHKPVSELGKRLCFLDTAILRSTDWNELLRYEDQIFKEYQFADLSDYRSRRANFLLESAQSESNDLLVALSKYVTDRKYRIAVFPGSFNPYHVGHEEVRWKAAKLFDKVILAVGQNASKPGTSYIDNLKTIFPQYQVVGYDTLLSDFTKSLGYPVTIVRGLRNGEDFGYEQRNLRFLQEFDDDIQIIYIPSSAKHEHISSSAIREIAKYSTAKAAQYLPTS